jgi:membrane-associated phospholipid phosphatase
VAERIKTPAFACLACALALALLAIAAYTFAPVERLDARALIHFSLPFESRPHRAADGIARLADPVPLLAMLLAACGFALALGRRREAVAAVVVVAGANLTTQVLKGLLAHPRYQLGAEYHQPWSDAFPSGHTTAAASIAVALMLVAPRSLLSWAALAGVAFAGAVGASVVALEWHYPSDVLGGVLVAAGWGFAALAALRARGDRGRSRDRVRPGPGRGPAPSYPG